MRITKLLIVLIFISTIVVSMNFTSLKEIKFSTIEKGFSSGITERSLLVIKNNLEWEELWKNHTKIKLPPPDIPYIDFNKEMVIAVFKGECPTTGFIIEIEKIIKEDNKVNIFIKEKEPYKESVLAQVLTQPYHIIKMEKIDIPVEFVY